MRTVVRQHLVAALHRADRRFEHGAAGVAEPLTGQQVRLLADHAFAADFLDLAVRVGNHPMPREQAGRHLAFVADRDRVGKSVVPFLGLGLLADVIGADVDTDLVDPGGLAAWAAALPELSSAWFSGVRSVMDVGLLPCLGPRRARRILSAPSLGSR